MSEDLDLTDEQIDSLVNPQPTNEVMPESAPPPQPEAGSEFAFKARGQDVQVKDLDQLKQYASKGYDYAQLVAEQRQKEEALAAREKELQQKYGTYEEIDGYAQKNPSWWEKINQSYQEQQTAAMGQQEAPEGSPDLSLSPEFNALKEQMQEVKAFKENLEREKQQQKQQEEDRALQQEIESIQNHYKDLDWKTVGPDGKTLEYKVLEHAQQIGTDSFRAAFRDFYHDHLVAKAEERGKETIAQEIQRNKKLGLLSETPAPLLKYKSDTNPKNLSYDELEKNALKELGIA